MGPFWWFPSEWICVCSRKLRVCPTNSPVRLGVSPATSTPTGFFSQRLWGSISPCWKPGLCSLCPQLFLLVYPHANVEPPALPAAISPTLVILSPPCLPWSSSCHLASRHLWPSCPSLPLLPIWVNVSSLTPWLSDFHTVWYSVGSGYVLFLNLLLSFWLCGEAKCIYLWLHLSWKSLFINYLLKYIYCHFNSFFHSFNKWIFSDIVCLQITLIKIERTGYHKVDLGNLDITCYWNDS